MLSINETSLLGCKIIVKRQNHYPVFGYVVGIAMSETPNNSNIFIILIPEQESSITNKPWDKYRACKVIESYFDNSLEYYLHHLNKNLVSKITSLTEITSWDWILYDSEYWTVDKDDKLSILSKLEISYE